VESPEAGAVGTDALLASLFIEEAMEELVGQASYVRLASVDARYNVTTIFHVLPSMPSSIFFPGRPAGEALCVCF